MLRMPPMGTTHTMVAMVTVPAMLTIGTMTTMPAMVTMLLVLTVLIMLMTAMMVTTVTALMAMMLILMVMKMKMKMMIGSYPARGLLPTPSARPRTPQNYSLSITMLFARTGARFSALPLSRVRHPYIPPTALDYEHTTPSMALAATQRHPSKPWSNNIAVSHRCPYTGINPCTI